MIAAPLNPCWFVVTPRGDGMARMIFDYGPDINPIFLVELNESREFLCFDMIDVRGSGNPAWGLTHPDPPESRA